MRLVPRTLFGRLTLVVLAVLVSAQLASLALHLHERGELLMQASGLRAAQRVADIVRLFDTVSPGDREPIARVLSAPPVSVSLDRPALAPVDGDTDAGARAALFGAMVRRLLGEERDVQVRARDAGSADAGPAAPMQKGMMRGMGGPWGMQGSDADASAPPYGQPYGPGMRYGARSASGLIAQVRLLDGTRVTVETRLPAQTVNWPYRLLWSVAILLGAAVVVALIAVRWATRPLDTLAGAAEALGRNLERPPIPETGPVEVARAARAFNTMQARLAEFVRSRTRLLAAMSHDLKTPVTRLRLRAELLDDPKARERFGADLTELEAMVQSTLDFLRGLGNEESARAFDVVAMLEALQADRTEAGADVTVEGRAAGPYTGQRQSLRRCLANLLDNAIQYGGRAEVVVKDGEDALEILIRDHGPGIPQDELEKVFEPFYRVESSRSRDTGGTGLGLAIARQIARAHGGEVTLANLPGGGLEARLVLSRRPRFAAPSAPPAG